MEKTFIKITNEDIYVRLVEIEKKLDTFKSRLRLAIWTGATALTLAIASLLKSS